MRVVDYIIEKVYQMGVKHIFMVTGRGVLFLSDAVAKNPGITGISVHHEQSAAYAATAYANYNEKIGVCLVSTGCGSTNAITGVLNAWQDNIPLVVISGQNMLNETSYYRKLPLRTFGNQEADIISIVKPITKYATMLTQAETCVYEVEKALYFAEEGRKGPVWIDIPLDIQNSRITLDHIEHFKLPIMKNTKKWQDGIAQVKTNIEKAERPILLIGSGIRSANAINECNALIKKYQIPVVYDCAATDIFPAENELSIGAVASLGGNRAGNFAIQNSDFVLVLGCRLSPVTTGDEYFKFARKAKIMVVDIDEIEHSKETIKIDVFIHSDVKVFLNALNKEKLDIKINHWREKCLHWKEIFPKCEEKYKKSERVDMYYLAECLSDVLPPKATFLSDAGMEELIFPSGIRFNTGQRCIHPASQGAMGVALPASIGAICASHQPVVSVIGDGSIMMNIQEFQTISYNKMPIKTIIINNNCYAVIRKRQEELFRNRTIGTDKDNGISCPEFKKIAESYGIKYFKIETSYNLKNELLKVIQFEGPVICEILGVDDQEYIRNSNTRNEKRRFVKRSLEDQAPFMDRSLFLSEMIIDPIDQ